MSDVVVCGSLNMDLIARVARLPAPGETLIGRELLRSAGGKGLNQALASARMGVPTGMIGAVGADADGRELLALLQRENIDIAAVAKRSRQPTGLAQVLLADSGENSIIVHPGANAALLPADLPEPLPSAVVYLAQLETPLDTIEAFFAAARRAGGCCVLNTAPAVEGSERLLPLADVLVMNETELGYYARTLTGESYEPIPLPAVATLKRVGRKLLQHPQQSLIITLGAAGALWLTHAQDEHIPAYPTDVVDTTGAGDCFCGVLAASIALGHVLPTALQRASEAAAIVVGRLGAAPAMPEATLLKGRANR